MQRSQDFAPVAVDAKRKLIVEQHATDTGGGLIFLTETADAAKNIFGIKRIDVVADMGRYMVDGISACRRVSLTPYCKPHVRTANSTQQYQ